tara:strand:+ start:1308 stop:2240 length:933 start_codon:yes stop_codon:yes gene_type:complete
MTIQQMLLATGSSDVVMPGNGYVNSRLQQQEITISNFIASGGEITIPSSLWIWSNSTSTPALTIDIPCTIINQGIILGCGGRGGSVETYYASAGLSGLNTSGNPGGPAIKINSGVTGVTINNNSGGFIYGGGGGGGGGNESHSGAGGGGGGAGGGAGGCGFFEAVLTAGGAIGATGNSSPRPYGGNAGSGGGSGAGSQNSSDSTNDGGSGGSGGRQVPPTFAASGGTGGNANWWYSIGGTGGNSNNVGGNAYNGTSGYSHFWSSGGGGGGYGANGGVGKTGRNGGSGGKAIDDSGQSYTLINNGQIYGGT